MNKNVLVLKHFEAPKEVGVYHRLVVLTGANKGESYVLMSKRVIIGRSEKADIKIIDIKASREHVEVAKVGNQWVATDLGSQNGFMINSNKVNQSPLGEGDKLIIGQTVFKFSKVEVSGKNGVLRENTGAAGGGSGGAENKKTSVVVIVLALALMGLFLMDDGEKTVASEKSRVKDSVPGQELTQEVEALKKRQFKEDKQVKERLNAIYQRGLREYREGNYFRAIHEFNLALIISPGDSQAEYYLRKTKEELDNSIDDFLAKAQRDEESLKYPSAIISYCSIIRLLYTVPEDPRHKNAVTQIKDLESKIGIDTGETNCLKKQRTDQ